MASGKWWQVKQRRTSVNFLRVLKDVVKAFPEQQFAQWFSTISTSTRTRRHSAGRTCILVSASVAPRHMHRGSTWRNVLQHPGQAGFIAKCSYLQRQLKEFLLDYIARNNENSSPFVWNKGPERLQHIIEARKEYQATHARKLRKHRRAPNTIEKLLETIITGRCASCVRGRSWR